MLRLSNEGYRVHRAVVRLLIRADGKQVWNKQSKHVCSALLRQDLTNASQLSVQARYCQGSYIFIGLGVH